MRNEEQVVNNGQKILLKKEKSLIEKLSSMKKHHQILFSLIIVIGVIFVWRGLWNIIERYWFSDMNTFSDISGIIVGLIILIITHKMINQLTGE